MQSTSPAASDNQKFYWVVPVVFIACVVSFFRLAYPLLNDNDVPWHIGIGKLLLETHRLPATDPWAYGNQDQPWFILSWVWNLALGVVQKCFGELGIYIFTLSVGGVLTAGITARLLALNIDFAAVLMTTLLTGLCMLDYLTARPQLAGYLLAFAYHALLHKSRGEQSYRSLKWLPPLMLVWTNAHGSFMVGFILIGAYAAEAWFTKDMPRLKRLIAIGAACAAFGLVNPYGPQVVLGALLSFQGSATRYTAEWLPFAFGVSTGVSLWLIVVVLTGNLKGVQVPMADKILTIVWFVATMLSIRNGAFFILTSAPYVAACIDEATRDLREKRPPSPIMLFMEKQKISHVWAACAAAFVVLCTAVSFLPYQEQIEGEDYSIKDAIDFIMEKHPEVRFYSDYNFGGQIIYHTAGKLHYFMDSRAVTAYSDDDMKGMIDFLLLKEGWQDALKKHNLNGIIAGKTTAFASSYDKGLFHEQWKRVFEGKRANVYVARK